MERALALALALGCAACGGSDAADPVAAREPVAEANPPAPRARDPRFLEAARALERGDLAAARSLSLALGSDLDADLLRARLAAEEGDDVAAVRSIEALRGANPCDARLYATSAELHAAAGRLDSAEAEIRAGLEACGPKPELWRARAVLALSRPGGAQTGLAHLETALRTDPGLEFCARPRAQAHVLLGGAALGAGDAVEALRQALAARAALPRDRDARELEADALAIGGDLDGAIAGYESLLSEGEPVQAALASIALRSAAKALLERDRAKAVERYLRARELGTPDAELGFGRTVLADEAKKAVEAGLVAYDGDDLVAAGAEFERALRLDPASIEAANHLAVVRFRQGEFSVAADLWRRVLEAARVGEIALPEPVHLNLARALHQAGREAEIHAVLDDYLARDPDGEWAAETREMLARLDLEASKER